MSQTEKHLYNLNELSDYKISDGYPDVRGWDVKDIDNRVIGKVDNLLINKHAQRVVYLDIEVDRSIIDAKHDPYDNQISSEVREFVNKDGDNHIIIPIGLVDLNTDSNYVYTDKLNHQTFTETKRYRKGDNVNRAYEVEVLDSYERKRHHNEREDKDPIVVSPTHNKIDNEDRIRKIVRKEIRNYHNNSDSNEDNFSKEEMELNRRRRNDVIDDDDQFYERREFDNDKFKKRTPGL